jgi:hypothetical protein
LRCNIFDDDGNDRACDLIVIGDARGVPAPQCDIPIFGFGFFGSFDCITYPGCEFVPVESPLQNIDTSYDNAVQLVFGAKASVGLVCAFTKESQDAVDNMMDLNILPGFCCLDSPYHTSQEEFWGTKAS